MHPQLATNWVFRAAIPAIYLVIELAFNYQLTNIAADTVSNETLAGLEFWGRIISGVGLGLLIYRLSLHKLQNRIIPLVVCLIGGILVMWNTQRELTEYLVATALPDDKATSIALSILSADAADGNLKTLQGHSIIRADIKAIEKRAVMALFPAAALHTERRVEQIQQWLQQKPGNQAAYYDYRVNPEHAYKKLIIPPIALGLSILFAILNLSLLISFFIEQFYKKRQLLMRSLIFLSLVIFSIQRSDGLIDSVGYQSSMRAGLWENKPVLAVLVEWAGSAGLAWGSISEFAGEVCLLGYSFRKPQWSPL